MEMQCYCDECLGECGNYVDYMHHHDWSQPSDYTCHDCLVNCLGEDENDYTLFKAI